LHMPVQSGSQPVLERMRRGYSVDEYYTLVSKIRAAMPDIAMSTDVIVGFPEETEEDYEKTVALIKDIRFDFAYLFKYSQRSGTYAAKKLPDDISEDVKGRRLRHLIEVQENISKEIFDTLIGKTFRVLVEGPSRRDENQLCGRTDEFKMT